MAKLQSSFKNMLISLVGVTFIASTALGLVYNVTSTPIKQAEQAKQTMAISAVLPTFDSLSVPYKILPTDGKDSLELFKAWKDGQNIATAIKTYTYSGFGGYIEIIAGIDCHQTITGFKVLKHAETPGLGSKMDQWFGDKDQKSQCIIGLTIPHEGLKTTKDGGTVDAITAATISSRAFLDAINRAGSVVCNTDTNSGATSVNK